MFRVPMSVSMPVVLLTLAACAPVTPTSATGDAAGSAASASKDATPTDTVSGGEATTPGERGGTPATASPGATAGNPGTVQPVPDEQIRVGPGIGDDSCKADAAQGFIGRDASEAVVKDAVRAAGAKTVRVIPHDGMVTMDYRGDRLNIQLDPQGKIVAITCG